MLTFSAASESGSAGIDKLGVVLPDGTTADDLTYKEGPEGWKPAPASWGYTVSGPKLDVGEDAEYVVVVRQLPDAKKLVFKTLQSYSDGRVDRWIELEDNAEDDHGHGHGHPALVLRLKPAAPGAKPVSPSLTQEPTTAAPLARHHLGCASGRDVGGVGGGRRGRHGRRRRRAVRRDPRYRAGLLGAGRALCLVGQGEVQHGCRTKTAPPARQAVRKSMSSNRPPSKGPKRAPACPDALNRTIAHTG
ncbi:DUF1775 domain-containing protein [Streptomyces sp. F001]|uniref:DUF1775 domain-containing protein n=1 Tax=Streptomyces sp. F001 TaxID=1510026 RepID=UPI0023EA72E8|nr:DUF1775 domain-containing protein [Streptomyces sp. F001]